jgi:hypothetical protein
VVQARGGFFIFYILKNFSVFFLEFSFQTFKYCFLIK